MTLEEPEYTYVRGKGWLVSNHLVICVCEDINNNKVEIIKRRPQPGEAFISIGAWADLPDDALILEVSRHVKYYSIDTWPSFTEHDAKYHSMSDKDFVTLRKL